MNVILIAIGLFMVLVVPILLLSGPNADKAKNRRLISVKERHASSTEAAMAAQLRKTIAARLPDSSKGSMLTSLVPNKELLALRLRRTGRGWQLQKYILACFGVTTVMAILLLSLGAPFIMILMLAPAVGFGLPHLLTGRMIKKRVNAFTERFPDAVDLLVRGLRSGLPVSETLNVVSSEIPGPVGEEFKGIVERIKIGKTMEAALQECADNLGTPEFQFFCITLSIQRETGGNLAETLSNLSDVLRKRAQMKLKIRAMSSEAKASAYIVGFLPFGVFGLVYMGNPEYLAGFFSDERLMIAGGGGIIWMGIGAAIMAKMISFEI